MHARNAVKRFIPRALFRKIEPYGHLVEAVLQNILKAFPAQGLKVIGVTGTDGKTTTAMLIAAMLRDSGHKVGLFTTISVDYGDGEGAQPSPTGQTTPSAAMLLDALTRMKRAGVEWVVLETSSHALAQYRVWGVPYSVAVMTNVTHEHLDYHGNFEKYLVAKRRLFEQTNRNKKGLRTGIVNTDDSHANRFALAIAHSLSYGTKQANVLAKNIKLTASGSHFEAVIAGEALQDQTLHIACNLPGSFNVSNSLAAVAVGMALGLSKEQIEAGITSLESVPGRMERVKVGQSFDVIVDYAVTPEALKNVLTSVRSVGKGKIHIVFGATGDRDKNKRPLMGEVAAELADHIYLTDDETYTENPDDIRQAVMSGIKKAKSQDKTSEIADRRAAIEAAITAAKPGDTVLLTGIGHQTSRNMGGKKQPWDERQIAAEILKLK